MKLNGFKYDVAILMRRENDFILFIFNGKVTDNILMIFYELPNILKKNML